MMININGNDGGGQILRTALSLSMVTGKKFRIQNIRGKRSKPGLKRQHLTCVNAAAEICNATVDGAEMNATELLFNPREIRSGDYEFRIGSAGSTTLLFQTLFPALMLANGVSTLRLHGGTHNPMAPSADFIARSFLPQMRKMGVEVAFECDRLGFAPAGGGVISATIQSAASLSSICLSERGKEKRRRIEILAANLRSSVVKEEKKRLQQILDWPESCYTVREEYVVDGSGNVVVIEVEYDNYIMHVTSHGAFQKTAARVAQEAAKAMITYLKGAAAIGPRMADQLLLPMALSGGGMISTTGLSNHIKTNIATIESFLDVHFVIEEGDRGEMRISLE